mgnify:CR=1 FL=1
MRAGFASTVMGIGGIFLSFGCVVFVLMIFASRSDPEHKLPTMSALAVACVVAGAVMVGLGFVLSRFGRDNRDGSLSANR